MQHFSPKVSILSKCLMVCVPLRNGIFLTWESRENGGNLSDEACAVITLCLGAGNFSNSVQNLAVKHKHEDI